MLLSEINSFDRVILAMDKKRLMKDIQGHINSEEEAVATNLCKAMRDSY